MNRIKIYLKSPHKVYGGMVVDGFVVKADSRPAMRVKPKKDLHRLVSECEAEIQTNAISVRHLFEKKLSRKERKRLHRS